MTSLRNNHICLETTRTINLAMNIPEVLQNSPFEIWGKSLLLYVYIFKTFITIFLNKRIDFEVEIIWERIKEGVCKYYGLMRCEKKCFFIG